MLALCRLLAHAQTPADTAIFNTSTTSSKSADTSIANRDSLVFAIVREMWAKRAAADSLAAAYLDAADDLARDGFFIEAADLLADTAKATVPAVPSIAPTAGEKQSINWSIATSAGYDAWNDTSTYGTLAVDSVTGAADRMFSGSAAATMAWRTRHEALDMLSPSVVLSESQAQAGVDWSGALLRRFLAYDGRIAGVKRLFQTCGDSSDEVNGRARMEISSAPAEWPVTLSLPGEGYIARTRVDRPEYPSLTQWSIRPSLTPGFSTSAWMEELYCDVGASDYSAAGDSLDCFSWEPGVSAEYYGDSASFAFLASYGVKNYRHSRAPLREKDLDISLDASVKPEPRRTWGLSLQVLNEAQSFEDTLLAAVDTVVRIIDTIYRDSVPVVYDTSITTQKAESTFAAYVLRGTTVDFAPSLEIGGPTGFAVKGTLVLQVKRYPQLKKLADGRLLFIPQYLWESLTGYGPELCVSWTDQILDAQVTGRYYIEDVAANKAYALQDSKTYGISVDVNWQIVSWLSFSASAAFERTFTAPDNAATDNASAFISFFSRFGP